MYLHLTPLLIWDSINREIRLQLAPVPSLSNRRAFHSYFTETPLFISHWFCQKINQKASHSIIMYSFMSIDRERINTAFSKSIISCRKSENFFKTWYFFFLFWSWVLALNYFKYEVHNELINDKQIITCTETTLCYIPGSTLIYNWKINSFFI